jgi:hypothetical protein
LTEQIRIQTRKIKSLEKELIDKSNDNREKDLEKREKDLEKREKSREKSQDKVINNLNVSECVICLESVPMTCFIPCGHISTCVSCAKCMVPPSCPICRCKDGRFYNVYNSTSNECPPSHIEESKEDLHPQEIVKRKSLIRRFLDKF